MYRWEVINGSTVTLNYGNSKHDFHTPLSFVSSDNPFRIYPGTRYTASFSIEANTGNVLRRFSDKEMYHKNKSL